MISEGTVGTDSNFTKSFPTLPINMNTIYNAVGSCGYYGTCQTFRDFNLVLDGDGLWMVMFRSDTIGLPYAANIFVVGK